MNSAGSWFYVRKINPETASLTWDLATIILTSILSILLRLEVNKGGAF